MIDPFSEWIVHFICLRSANTRLLSQPTQPTNLDIGEICLHHPNPSRPRRVRNRVLMLDPDIQLFPHERPRAFAPEQDTSPAPSPVLCHPRAPTDLDRILRVRLLVAGEALDRPRPLDPHAVLLQVLDEDALNAGPGAAAW